jgi:hypothetical protein
MDLGSLMLCTIRIRCKCRFWSFHTAMFMNVVVAVPLHEIAPAEGRARQAAAALIGGQGSGQEAGTPHPSPHFHTCTRAFLKENSHEK